MGTNALVASIISKGVNKLFSPKTIISFVFKSLNFNEHESPNMTILTGPINRAPCSGLGFGPYDGPSLGPLNRIQKSINMISPSAQLILVENNPRKAMRRPRSRNIRNVSQTHPDPRLGQSGIET
jgi:hypothetical protein